VLFVEPIRHVASHMFLRGRQGNFWERKEQFFFGGGSKSVMCFIVSNCSIYVVIFSIFLWADVSALVHDDDDDDDIEQYHKL